MTCVAGLVHGRRVYMAADSFIGDTNTGAVDRTLVRKIWIVPKTSVVVGFSGSVRLGQLLQAKLRLPAIGANADLDEWMTCEFVDAVWVALRDYSRADLAGDEPEYSLDLLVGTKARLWEVDRAETALPLAAPYGAVGEADTAVAVLAATKRLRLPPKDRLALALELAAERSAFVRGPWHFLSVAP